MGKSPYEAYDELLSTVWFSVKEAVENIRKMDIPEEEKRKRYELLLMELRSATVILEGEYPEYIAKLNVLSKDDPDYYKKAFELLRILIGKAQGVFLPPIEWGSR